MGHPKRRLHELQLSKEAKFSREAGHEEGFQQRPSERKSYPQLGWGEEDAGPPETSRQPRPQGSVMTGSVVAEI